MSESNKKTLRTITTILVCLAIVFAFFISIIRVFGFKVYGVLTGSMEPAYPTGSLIYVRDVDPNTLRIGDVITFSLSPNVIATHRIVDIVADENNPNMRRFQTKGDANNSVDASLVNPTHIIGKVAFSVPYLGDIANYIQNPPGTYVAILVSGVLIFLVFLTDAATSEKFKFLQKKEAAPQQPPVPAGAGYPAGQQPGAYSMQPPAGYPPQASGGYPSGQQLQQQGPGAYPRQMDPRYNVQQPMQNSYPQQPPRSEFPQQQQAGSYPYHPNFPGQQPQYSQQAAPQPYPQSRQPAAVGYRAPQQAGYPPQQPVPPQQRPVSPQMQGYQPPAQQPAATGYPPPVRPNFQPSGFVPSQQSDGMQRRRRSSNQVSQ